MSLKRIWKPKEKLEILQKLKPSKNSRGIIELIFGNFLGNCG
jgi:hypothetical protein